MIQKFHFSYITDDEIAIKKHQYQFLNNNFSSQTLPTRCFVVQNMLDFIKLNRAFIMVVSTVNVVCIS